MTDQFLNTKEFAKLSGLSTNQISKYLRNGSLKGEKKSGKWQIPKSELDSPVVKGASAPAPAKETAPKAPAPQPSTTTSGALTVAEFAQKTFLTEKGVLEWITKGRINGIKDANGQWQISAASLEDPAVAYLVR